MKDLQLYVPTEFRCAPEAVRGLGRAAADIGSRFLLVSEEYLQEGRQLRDIRSACEDAGVETILFGDIQPYSTAEAVERARDLARVSRCEGIIAFGDVHTLSISRALAAGVGEDRDPDTGTHRQQRSALPYIELPSTFRSPFLCNGGSVLTFGGGEVVFRSSRQFFPRLTIIDPEILGTYTVKYRLSSLMDAFLLAVEGYFSDDSTFFSDTLLLRAIGLAISALPELLKDPAGREPLFTGAQAGFFAGYGLAMSSYGLGTAASYVISAMKQIPQPVIATILLPYVLEYGLRVCPEKVARMGPILGENLRGLSVVAAADRVVEKIRASIGVEQLPGRLSDLGVRRNELSFAASRMVELTFLNSLPAAMSRDEIEEFLRDAL
jgi:alcohol dehydrogenase class IV